METLIPENSIPKRFSIGSLDFIDRNSFDAESNGPTSIARITTNGHYNNHSTAIDIDAAIDDVFDKINVRVSNLRLQKKMLLKFKCVFALYNWQVLSIADIARIPRLPGDGAQANSDSTVESIPNANTATKADEFQENENDICYRDKTDSMDYRGK